MAEDKIFSPAETDAGKYTAVRGDGKVVLPARPRKSAACIVPGHNGHGEVIQENYRLESWLRLVQPPIEEMDSAVGILSRRDSEICLAPLHPNHNWFKAKLNAIGIEKIENLVLVTECRRVMTTNASR